jgi:hypothetical protein
MSKPKDPPDPSEEPEPPAPEDFAARRLKEFLAGRFPGKPLPPGLPVDEQPEELLPQDETEQAETQDKDKATKEGPEQKPRKPKKPKSNR